ncbi:hypothetical protein BKA61DRAFT_322951 [Leptodontidium sp. MPI-SDFR-AT-0119]|nr:hypothetical protein BKA61DRAFT_322951 [Leptodontidium sp. MPI-SDFR-AT-0119]
MTPQSCLFFLATTVSHLQLLTSLAIHLPSRQTDRLEPIARKLYLANVPLRSLTIHLVSLPERFNHVRIVTAYMLPRRIGISALGYQEMDRRKHSPYYWSGNSQLTSIEHFIYADTHSGLAVRLSESCNAALGMLKSVRYLAVHGQPKDGLDFELAILKLHLRMLEVAKSEGREVVLGKKSKGPDEDFWYYDVWIQGEFEEE